MGRRNYLNTIAGGFAIGSAILGSAVAVPFAMAPVTGIPVGLLSLVTAWSHDPTDQATDEANEPALSPAEVIAMRFPEQWDDSAVAPAEESSAVEVPSKSADFDPFAHVLFSPYPSYARAAVELGYGASVVATAPESVPPTRTAAVAPRPAVAPPPHRSGRPDAMFNDAQIATIKQRLRLTPDQEHMWPAVEAALRNLSYPKGTRKPGVDVTRVAAIDPHSAEVQNLSSAAVPLVMSFSDDQRRELRVLAHVAGLEDLVPKF
jgi:hypothetical protein